MPEITIIIIDNALNSQNQDYFPNRFVLQKEVINEMIIALLETSPENLVGIIPFGQDKNSDILTPTKTRPFLTTFLHQIDLKRRTNYSLSLFQADQSLHVSDLSTKTIVVFLSSPVDQFDEVFANIYNIVSKGIIFKAICFADAVEFGHFLKKELKYENFECLILDDDVNFKPAVADFLQSSYKVEDADLEEAIRRSLYQ